MRPWTWILCAALGLSACGGDSDEPAGASASSGDEATASNGDEDANAGPRTSPDGPRTSPDGPRTSPDGPRTSPDGMCGGIAGFACPDDQWCDMGEAAHPDASGTCRPHGACDEPADCEGQEIVHAMCVGEWTCRAGECGWACDEP